MAEAPIADVLPREIEREIDVDDDADWLRLTSGEWLRGELVRVRDDTLDFASDSLGDQSIALEDVARLVSKQHQVVLMEDGRTFDGTLEVDEESIWVKGGDKTIRVRREGLLSVLALDGIDAAIWSLKVSLGATFRSGNTDQTDYTAVVTSSRESARSRWTGKYTGAISSVNDTETANNHRLGTKLDLFLTRRAFLTAPGLDVFRDPFQNIDVRVTPYAALGYQVVDTADHTWSVSAGPAFQYVKYESETEEHGSEEGSAAGVFSSDWSWDLTSDVDLRFTYDITVPLPDTHAFNHNAVLSLAVDLPRDLDLDLSFIWDRVNDPQREDGGDLPEPDDFRMLVGLGWSF